MDRWLSLVSIAECPLSRKIPTPASCSTLRDRTGSLVALPVSRTPHCLPLFTDPSVSPRSSRSSSANFAFPSAIIARSRSRTSLRPTCFILVSSARSCALTASPAAAVCALSRLPSSRSVGIRSICSNFCNPSRVTRSSSGRQCLPVRRCYLHHRFLLHDHRQTYRWIAPIAFERLLPPPPHPRPPLRRLARAPPQPATGSICDRNAEMHRE